MTKQLSSAVQAVIETFEDFFELSGAAPFGNPTNGASDGAEGVQWSAFWRGNQAFLGVNLEGMEYKDWAGGAWPVGTLIQRELEVPTLVQRVSSYGRRDEIELSWRRDAWQVRSRPQIAERDIKPTPIRLVALTAEAWQGALHEARSCLGPDYRGRMVQRVTRLESRATEEMEVTPHLQFRVQIWDGSPLVPNRRALMKNGRNVLRPLHEWVVERCS